MLLIIYVVVSHLLREKKIDPKINEESLLMKLQ